jgi:methionyl-tRNA synthetase
MSGCAHVLRYDRAALRPAYGILTREIFPEPDDDTLMGFVWAEIDPGGSTEPHHHDDHEAFVIVEGSAVVTVGGDEPPGPAEVLVRGDVVFVPSGVEHIISNRGDVTLRLLAIWWEAGIRPRPTGGAA